MECPACKRTLRERGAGPFTVDTCPGGCGGIRLDDGEFTSIYEEIEQGQVGSPPRAQAMDQAVTILRAGG